MFDVKSRTKINGFSGEYRWLSNFWMAPITFADWTFPSSEHAYQAAKSENPREWQYIAGLRTAGQAKRAGRDVTLRNDWNTVRLEVMEHIQRAKYYQHQNLRDLLIATGDLKIIEKNTWGDTFWGVCNYQGENHLGKIIMKIREELR